MITRTIISIVTISTVLLNCAQTGEDIPRVKSPEFLTDTDAIEYADSILGTLTTEERIAQLLMVPVYSRSDTTGWSEAEHWVRDLGLGGIIVMQGGPENQRVRIRRMQNLAEVPLLVASDAEWGLGMRLDSTRSFPRAMTLGATGDTALVREFGEIVGLSLRQTGVQVNFAPVVEFIYNKKYLSAFGVNYNLSRNNLFYREIIIFCEFKTILSKDSSISLGLNINPNKLLINKTIELNIEI